MCFFCSTILVNAKYYFDTLLCRYRYIARERLSFYAEGLHMLNGCLVCYVKLLIVQSNVLVHDIKHWSPPTDQRANQRQQTRHLWGPGLRNIVNARTTATNKSSSLKQRYLKSRRRYGRLSRLRPHRSNDWSRRASVAGWRWRCLRATTTGDITGPKKLPTVSLTRVFSWIGEMLL